jgi:hypothetical protein
MHLTDVSSLLARRAGARVDALFMTAMADVDFELVDLTGEDCRRDAELVETYANLPLGTTDATVVALAARRGLNEVAALIGGTSVLSGRGMSRRCRCARTDHAHGNAHVYPRDYLGSLFTAVIVGDHGWVC